MCALLQKQKYKNIFHEWADILDQAHYKGVRQITGHLQDDDGGRCAMGVLADHYNGPTPWTMAENTAEYYTYNHLMRTLTVLNDIDGFNFHEIAEYLRSL